MKITKVETIHVALPFIPAIRKYRPQEQTDRPILLIKLYTDEGIVGIGEGGRGQQVEEETPQWIGVDPLQVNLRTTQAPFQAALYDIVGKALGVPAWRLMGDEVREVIPLNYWSCYMDPRDTAREAEVGASLGFKVHKLKARSWDIVEQCQLIAKAAGPDYAIVVDPNGTFETTIQTLKIARALEDYSIQCFEDPIDKPLFHQLAVLRGQMDIPLAPHLASPVDTLLAVRLGCADMFNFSGNLDVVLRSAAIAQTEGIPVWIQIAGLSLGVAAAFATHACTVIPNATLPADTLHFLREDDLLKDHPLTPVEGAVRVPEGPGLGVELDEKAVERYRV